MYFYYSLRQVDFDIMIIMIDSIIFQHFLFCI